jgi:hypothetical protein
MGPSKRARNEDDEEMLDQIIKTIKEDDEQRRKM